MKKNLLKKLLSATLVAAMAISLAACGGNKGADTTSSSAGGGGGEAASEASGDKVTIVIIPKLVHEFYNLVLDGANLAVDELKQGGKEVEIIWSAPTQADVTEQTDKLEAAIALNPDYIAISVIDGESCKALMEEAQSKGIKVIDFDTTFEGSPASSFVGCDLDAQYASGALHADTLVKLIGKDSGKIAMLTGSPDAENHKLFSGGFRDRMKEAYPDFEIVTEQADNDDKEQATKLTEAILGQYPDIDGIFGGDGSAGVGAAVALEAAVKAGQIPEGQVKISNVCLMPDPEAALKSGYLSCIIDYSPYWIGYYLTMAAAADYFDGIPLQNVPLQFAVVTAENLDGYDYSSYQADDLEYWK